MSNIQLFSESSPAVEGSAVCEVGVGSMESESDRYAIRLLTFKIVGALALLGCLVVAVLITFPDLRPLIYSNSVIDQGRRGLVVISTQGGDRPLTLKVRNYVHVDGSMTMVVYFSGDNVTYSPYVPITYQITFAGEATGDGFHCAPEESEQGWDYTTLPIGTQNAIDNDARGGEYSALNFGGSVSKSVQKALHTATYVSKTGTLWLLNAGTDYSEREAPKDWTASCTVPSSYLWRYPTGSTGNNAERRTLLIPQVDWTSMSDKTDHENQLQEETWIQRASGQALTESYPSASSLATGWYYNSDSHWLGNLGETSNIGSSDQPVFVFTDRTLDDKRALVLLFGGVILGVVAALIVQLLSRTVDLIALKRRVSRRQGLED